MVEVQAQAVAVEIRIADDALVGHVGDGAVVLGLVGAPGHGEVVVGAHPVVEDVVLVVVARDIYELGRQVAAQDVDRRPSCEGVDGMEALADTAELFAIGRDVDLFAELVHVYAGAERDLRFARCPALGRDDDDPVGGAGAVHGSGGGPAEHVDALDVFGVDVGESVGAHFRGAGTDGDLGDVGRRVAHDDAVNDVERVGVAADGVDPAQAYGQAPRRIAGVLRHLGPCDFALQGGEEVVGTALLEGFGVDDVDRVAQLTAGGLEGGTRHDDLVEGKGIFFKGDVQVELAVGVVNGNSLGEVGIAQVAHLQGIGPAGYRTFQHVLAVQVGKRALAGFEQLNRHPDEWLVGLVRYNAGNGICHLALPPGYGRRCKQQGKCDPGRGETNVNRF